MIGAGAAGLMAAIAAGRTRECLNLSPAQLPLFLFDSRNKIGAKILISGGTRCNVTNKTVTVSDYEGGPKHFLKHVFDAFSPAETIRFFEEIGVELVLEPTGKYFPTTHSGRTVLEALLKELGQVNVPLKSGIKITDIEKKEDFFELISEKEIFHARRVVLATGGLSYPETGSDGTGLSIAQKMGHSIISTCPALTPLVTEDADWQALSGITLEARLSFFSEGKKKAQSEGSFLFTHFGFSGPVALDLSRHFASSAAKDKRIEVNFIPSQNEESLLKEFEKTRQSQQRVSNFLSENFSLPTRFAELVIKKMGWPHSKTIKECSTSDRSRLVQALLHAPLPVSGVVGYKKAEATAGGVDLRQVRVSTLESKIVPGLFFAGEILDVDGRIGGFNFQWAWSSGVVAGRGAMKA